MVNETLARGLQRRTIAAYRDMAERYDQVFLDVFEDAMDGKWTAKRAKALLTGMRNRVAKRSFYTYEMAAVSGAGCWVISFAPRVEGDRLWIDTVRLEVHPRRRPTPPHAVPTLQLTPHAIERLFFRLRTVDHSVVQKELCQGLMLAFPLMEVSDAMGLTQMPLPTGSGTFLCEARPGEPMLARTWLRNNNDRVGPVNLPPRWERVVRTLNSAVVTFAKAKPEENPLWMRLAAVGQVHALKAMTPALQAALEPFPWLKDAYRPGGEDPQTALWSAARAQAQNESINDMRMVCHG